MAQMDVARNRKRWRRKLLFLAFFTTHCMDVGCSETAF